MSMQGSPQLAVTTLGIEAAVAVPFGFLLQLRPHLGGAYWGLMALCMVLAIPVILLVAEAWEKGYLHAGRAPDEPAGEI